MLDALLQYAGEKDRVCPVPLRWDELWKMLPDRRRERSDWEPPLPLILGAWWHTSNLDKIVRLRVHIEWANEHGVLEQVDSFLRGLPESDWHHLKD